MTNPEVPQNHIPTLEAVTTAYADVLCHNKRYTGFGAGSINLLSAIVEAEEANPDAPVEDIDAAVNAKITQATIEGDMEGELQSILHEDTFMRIGIKLTPFGGQLTRTDGEQISSTELAPMIENTELFTDFLAQVDAKKIQEDESSLALVTDVVTTLQRTIASCYGKMPEDASEERQQAVRQYGEDALRTFLQVDEAFKKLGLDRPAIYQHYITEGTSGYLDDQWKRHNTATKYLATYKTLEDYVTYWGRDVLPEYLATGPMDYLAQDKKYAFDGMYDHLVKDVDGIIDLTNSARTFDFGVEAAQAMLTGIGKTIQEMDEKPDDWFVSEYNRQFLVDNAARLQSAINPEVDN